VTALPDFLQPLDRGLYLVDTGFKHEHFDAAYLLVDNGHAAFIDTGTNHSVPRFLAALDALGLPREAVDFVIPTHVHLDHAGGVGLLMQSLPRAELLVHPLGARHMIDPSKLMAGATAVYGEEEIARSYGTVIGVPAERVRESHDGMDLLVGQRRLHLIDTPGHARHHHCIWDEATRGWFTGDTFGLSYREFDTAHGAYLLPTTSPVQFDPEALRHSVQRLLAKEPEAMYLTHFGRVANVPQLAQQLLDQLDAMVAIGHRLKDAPGRHDRLVEALKALYLGRLAEHGVPTDHRSEELLAVDIELNAQGLGIWLDKK
jgi:glyoxylase-like metal-dependent hydrolase (beta-lactamase superfamily II)